MALALVVQQGSLPPVSPGLCLAAASRLEGAVSAIRGALEDEGAAVRQGRKSAYSPARLDRMMDANQVDAANIAKVKARYVRAAPSQADLAQAAKMPSDQSARYVAACAA